MRVPVVNFNNMTSSRYRVTSVSDNNGNLTDTRLSSGFADIPYVYPISFSAAENREQAKLRKLFSYDLPCMYSGIKMIDPKQMSKWLSTGLYNQPISVIIETLEPYDDRFEGMQKKALDLIKEQAEAHPKKHLKKILEDIEPEYKKLLRSSQNEIFKELQNIAKELPDNFNRDFANLMKVTEKRLNEQPVMLPFSSAEFKYELCKINSEIQNTSDAEAKEAMYKIIRESQRFAPKTNQKNIEEQHKILKAIDHIVKKSELNKNKQLKELIEISNSKLMSEKVVIPFSRKQFLYDLHKILDGLDNNELRSKLIGKAEELPTSKKNFSAYIVKLSSNPPEKVLQSLVWPYIASIEHLKPKSEGGDRFSFSNLGIARTALNSERRSQDFKLWLHEHPETRKNCQKYVDKLIQLDSQGVFKKLGIDTKYIVDFKNTIFKLSDGELNLNISKILIK